MIIVIINILDLILHCFEKDIYMRSPQYSVPTTLALVISSLLAPNAFAEESEQDTETMIVRSTAEEALKQQPGVSIITAEDIAKQPPVNDLSDIIRKMPGVNLTGNSASGSRGNNRQIDIRGMGPENTLILIDGVPVTSRNAVRYSWRGERDTRGDSNWVPAEMVERIEVLRGPAAARYGSGAAGGVVNIITKRPTNTWHGSLSFFTNQPENNKEGTTNRANFNLSGPLAGEALTMRLYGNINKTEPDAWDINHAQNGSYAAGREGVRNKDINALLSWKMTPQQILDFSYAIAVRGISMLVIPSTATAILARTGWWTPCTATKLIASIASPGDSPTTVYGIGASPKPVFTTRKPTIPACRKALPAESKA